jgi:hypothetical protein
MPHLFADLIEEVTQVCLGTQQGKVEVPVHSKHVPVVASGGTMWDCKVFTIPGSLWKDHEALLGAWPPPHVGKGAKCLKWTASLIDGWLVMKQDSHNELRCAPRVVRRGRFRMPQTLCRLQPPHERQNLVPLCLSGPSMRSD